MEEQDTRTRDATGINGAVAAPFPVSNRLRGVDARALQRSVGNRATASLLRSGGQRTTAGTVQREPPNASTPGPNITPVMPKAATDRVIFEGQILSPDAAITKDSLEKVANEKGMVGLDGFVHRFVSPGLTRVRRRERRLPTTSSAARRVRRRRSGLENGAGRALDDMVGGNADDGWRTLMLAVAHVELCAVDGTGQQRPAQASLRQPRIAVGAVVLHGMEHPVDPAHHDAMGTNVGKAAQLPVAQVRQVAEGEGLAHRRRSVGRGVSATRAANASHRVGVATLSRWTFMRSI